MIDVSKEKISAFDSAMEKSGKAVIVSHVHPDGDALGSVTAICSFLRECRGKNASIILPDAPPAQLMFICEGFDILSGLNDCNRKLILEADLIIALDFNAFRRADVLEKSLQDSKAFKVLIDHHPNPDESEFDLVFSRTDVSSSCEHLFYILKMFPDKIPARCAESMMAGMTTDTNNFANSVFPSTFGMAAELISAGVDRNRIIQKIYFSGRAERVRAWSHILDRKLVLLNCGAAYMILDRKTSESFSLVEGETDGLVNIPLEIKKIRLSALLTEENGYFRVSLRSKEGIDVNELAAAHFHGGGHVRASGGRLYIPDDIPDSDAAAGYFEEVTARFMRNNQTAKH